MPLFDFECRNCGARFETLVRSTDRDEDRVCPVCGKTDARRLLAAPAAVSPSGGARAAGRGCGGAGRFT